MFKPTLFPDVKPQDRPYPFPSNPEPHKPTFTVQENLIETTRRVNETLDRVLRMEEHIRKTLESYTSTITADNVAFKNLMTTTHNQFAGEVTNEINAFEADLTNAYSSLSTDCHNQIDAFTNRYVEEMNAYKEELNGTYETFREAVDGRLEQYDANYVKAFNDYVTEMNLKLATMEKNFTSDYNAFTNAINQSITEFKTKWVAEIEARLDGQDSVISDAVLYLKTNLRATVVNEVREMRDNGEMAEILDEEVLAHKVEDDLFNSTVETLATKSEVDIERKRIDNLTALPEGSTTGDAELADVRVGADNVTYDTAGKAVRSQFEKVISILTGNKFLHGIGNAMPEQGDFPYADVNDFPVNSVASTTGNCEWLVNQPRDGFVGTIITLSQSTVPKLEGGCVQIAFNAAGTTMYTRIAWNHPVVWQPWRATTLGSLGEMVKTAYLHIKESETHGYTSFDELPLNAILVVDNVALTNSPRSNPCGTYISFKPLSGDDGGVQFFIQNNGRIYFRFKWSGNWRGWNTVSHYEQDIVPIENSIEELKGRQATVENIVSELTANSVTPIHSFISSFLKIGCVGDSLASGESQYTKSDGTKGLVDLYDHSWGQFMAREYGVEVINFSSGGQTTRSWLTSSVGLTKATTEGNKCNAYIIGLGQNDKGKLGTDYLGTINDIDVDNCENNADTYYGNYAKIIQKLKEVQPKAKFFLLPDPIDTENVFNVAVSDIANLLDNCYFIDLMKYAEMYATGGFFRQHNRGGHYNSVAYNYMGKLIGKEISNYMNEHPDEFSQVEFIGTDYTY